MFSGLLYCADCGEKLFSQKQLENAQIVIKGLPHFINKAKKVTQLTELTSEIVHEFIQKIVVGKPK